MPKLLLLSNDVALRDRVAAAVGGSIAALGGAIPATAPQVAERIRGIDRPDVLVLDPSDQSGALDQSAVAAALSLTSSVRAAWPTSAVVIVAPPELGLDALRAGAADVIARDASDGDLSASIARAVATIPTAPAAAPAAPAAPEQVVATDDGRIVTVFSPKGGSGRTTVAVNVALELAKQHPGKVAIVDLDLSFGDVGNSLALKPESTIEAVLDRADLANPLTVKLMLAQHKSGLSVLCAPDHPSTGGAIHPAGLSPLLLALASQFAYVVVDTSGLDDATLAAMDVTTDAILVAPMDGQGVRALSVATDVLRSLRNLPERRWTALTYYDERNGISQRDAESTLRAPVDFRLPHSPQARASVNLGIPLSVRKPRDPLARGIAAIATALSKPAPGITFTKAVR